MVININDKLIKVENYTLSFDKQVILLNNIAWRIKSYPNITPFVPIILIHDKQNLLYFQKTYKAIIIICTCTRSSALCDSP